jgi:hypothetical protein
VSEYVPTKAEPLPKRSTHTKQRFGLPAERSLLT